MRGALWGSEVGEADADQHVALRRGAAGEVPSDRRVFADTSRRADLPAAELDISHPGRP
ncbi:hypothetical protein E4N62_10500 [Streptomyces sp. MNU76]|uniref:hypothetical protein n=1 Tax=Streptomyces sp. MNU76 TaxID=2560026 RepID=UPI001E42A890|nr:hypothetical protein [Streptomyces sp. MNU76]MCC9705648.1 hypothetical protein [Streptomyces sp. MNU76]